MQYELGIDRLDALDYGLAPLLERCAHVSDQAYRAVPCGAALRRAGYPMRHGRLRRVHRTNPTRPDRLLLRCARATGAVRRPRCDRGLRNTGCAGRRDVPEPGRRARGSAATTGWAWEPCYRPARGPRRTAW